MMFNRKQLSTINNFSQNDWNKSSLTAKDYALFEYYQPKTYNDGNEIEPITNPKQPSLTYRPWRTPLISMVYNHIVSYPASSILNYLWGFGSLAGLALTVQIVTGIFLVANYTDTTEGAFRSVERIMRDVDSGWLMRYLHANGASAFFFVVYIHMARGLYFKSYITKPYVWLSGVLIFFLMMGTAFMGYVLPWGQMSYWGATVITNLVTAIPLIGQKIVYWVWGGYSVGNPTLQRFFSAHYIFPILIAFLSGLHIALLHIKGSSNPAVVDPAVEYVRFSPYFVIKDLWMLTGYLIIYLTFVFYMPNALGHPDNYEKANELVTPTHIVPEWYFLPFYAILRACPYKLGGVVLMIAAILVMAIVPYWDKADIQAVPYNMVLKTAFWIFVFNFMALLVLGGCPAEGIYVIASRICTTVHFFYFVLPLLLIMIEIPRPTQNAISYT